MKRALTQDEIAAARSDPRYVSRDRFIPHNQPNKTVDEILVADLLDLEGIKFEYEDRFFPTFIDASDIVRAGFCPDFRILATDDWPEQYLELTGSLVSELRRQKLRKADKAVQIYHIFVTVIRPTLLAEIEGGRSIRSLLVGHQPAICPIKAAA